MHTSKEKIALANAAIELLDDDEMVKQFAENVKQVGTWANQIDACFNDVTRKFNDMVEKYGRLYPGLFRYRDEWVGYNKVMMSSFLFRGPLLNSVCFPELE
jgi:hypothetical protein